MQLWVGLGNPGAEHALQRHNIGFMSVDAIAASHDFSPWRKRLRGWTSEGSVGSHKLLLLKPATYMNESGRSVGEAARFFKLTANAITLFHDELDLTPFKVKVKVGGGTAGHNGLRSTAPVIGPDFRRVRLGIGHPGHRDRVTPHVLGNFAKVEMDGLSDTLGAVAAEAGWLASGDDARFMSDVAMRQADAP